PDRGLAVVVLELNGRAVGLPGQVRIRRIKGSAVARHVPARPQIAETAAADDAGALQFPDENLAARILQTDVGEAVAVVIAGPDDVPVRPGIGDDAAADHARAVHFPDGNRAVGVLPQDVGDAVAVEIAGADRMPARPRIGDDGAADHA